MIDRIVDRYFASQCFDAARVRPRCACCKALIAGTVGRWSHAFRGFAVETCDSHYCRWKAPELMVMIALREYNIERAQLVAYGFAAVERTYDADGNLIGVEPAPHAWVQT